MSEKRRANPSSCKSSSILATQLLMYQFSIFNGINTYFHDGDNQAVSETALKMQVLKDKKPSTSNTSLWKVRPSTADCVINVSALWESKKEPTELDWDWQAYFYQRGSALEEPRREELGRF